MSGASLIALDAATGTPAAGFGSNGAVDVGVSYGGTPTIFENVAIIGAASLELPQGAPGNPRAFDVRTGAKLWEFQTVPRAGEPFNETWGDGWEGRGGTNMWAFAAPIDAALGLAYLPIAGPAANYYGGDRPGNNVFANSIVAVDARTGEYKWHFQTVHHDLWDTDMPSAGGLLEVERNGTRVPAIAHVGKSAFFYVLDRTTGQPFHEVRETPVPKGDVPTEWYSPTQPIPVRPPPLARVQPALPRASPFLVLKRSRAGLALHLPSLLGVSPPERLAPSLDRPRHLRRIRHAARSDVASRNGCAPLLGRTHLYTGAHCLTD